MSIITAGIVRQGIITPKIVYATILGSILDDGDNGGGEEPGEPGEPTFAEYAETLLPKAWWRLGDAWSDDEETIITDMASQKWKYFRINVANSSDSLILISELQILDALGGSDLTVPTTPIWASSEINSSNKAVNAINDVMTTGSWVPDTNTNEWIKVKPDVEGGVLATAFSIQASNNAAHVGHLPKDFTLEVSMDDAIWYEVFSVTGETGWSTSEEREYAFDLSSVTKTTPAGYVEEENGEYFGIATSGMSTTMEEDSLLFDEDDKAMGFAGTNDYVRVYNLPDANAESIAVFFVINTADLLSGAARQTIAGFAESIGKLRVDITHNGSAAEIIAYNYDTTDKEVKADIPLKTPQVTIGVIFDIGDTYNATVIVNGAVETVGVIGQYSAEDLWGIDAIGGYHGSAVNYTTKAVVDEVLLFGPVVPSVAEMKTLSDKALGFGSGIFEFPEIVAAADIFIRLGEEEDKHNIITGNVIFTEASAMNNSGLVDEGTLLVQTNRVDAANVAEVHTAFNKSAGEVTIGIRKSFHNVNASYKAAIWGYGDAIGAADAEYGIHLYLQSITKELSLSYKDGSTVREIIFDTIPTQTISATANPRDNEDIVYNIVVKISKDGSDTEVKLFMDGVLTETKSSTGFWLVPSQALGGFYINNNDNYEVLGAKGAAGRYANLTVFGSALDDETITALHNNSLSQNYEMIEPDTLSITGINRLNSTYTYSRVHDTFVAHTGANWQGFLSTNDSYDVDSGICRKPTYFQVDMDEKRITHMIQHYNYSCPIVLRIQFSETGAFAGEEIEGGTINFEDDYDNLFGTYDVYTATVAGSLHAIPYPQDLRYMRCHIDKISSRGGLTRSVTASIAFYEKLVVPVITLGVLAYDYTSAGNIVSIVTL